MKSENNISDIYVVLYYSDESKLEVMLPSLRFGCILTDGAYIA